MLLPRRAASSRLCRGLCDLSRAEQGSLTSLLGNLQAAEAGLSATYPEIFTRAWADHETMLAALDDLTAADRVRFWHRPAHTRLWQHHQPHPTSQLRLVTNRESIVQGQKQRMPPVDTPGAPAVERGYSGWRSGTSFQGAPGLRPQAAAANTVSTKSRNVMTCTLVQ